MKIVLNIVKPDDVITNDWSVIDIARKKPPIHWEKVFKDADEELNDISEILENDKKVNGRFYPDCKDLFKAFELTSLQDVKVVLFSQEPFYTSNPDGTPVAQGLAFSVKRGAKIPPSLINIYKEIKNTVPDFNIPNHGCLEEWSKKNGILLLNSCLTVRPGMSGSHGEIWLSFIKKVINAIIDANPYCIFVLWGRQVQKIRKMLGERVTVLEGANPPSFKGFFGCNHFAEINNLLTGRGQKPINWNLL